MARGYSGPGPASSATPFAAWAMPGLARTSPTSRSALRWVTGVIDNTPSELGRWLKNPQQIKAGSHMPNLQLADGEVADLVAYLETLR